MIAEKIGNQAKTVVETLEAEGILPFDELKDYTNLDERDLLLTLGWLYHDQRISLFPHKDSELNVMLVY